jgi:hypothetical protein
VGGLNGFNRQPATPSKTTAGFNVNPAVVFFVSTFTSEQEAENYCMN